MGRLAVLPLVIALSACEAPDRMPVSEPYPGGPEARVVEPGQVPLIEHLAPAESLLVRPEAPRGPATLAFFRGRGVASDGGDRAYILDGAASRVLVVDRELHVVGTVGGPSLADGGLGLPLSVAAGPGGGVYVVDVEHAKGLLYFDSTGRAGGSAVPPVLNGELAAGPGGTLWATRSPYLLGFDPTEAGDPLLYRFDPMAGEGVGIAEVEPMVVHLAASVDADTADAASGAWNRLANAGTVAVSGSNLGVFAFLLQNELRGYEADGMLLWRSSRRLSFDASPPEVIAGPGEDRMIGFRPVTQALTTGPDGFLYALTSTDEIMDRRRLEVWDPATGALLRAATLPSTWTTFAVDDEGRVFRVDPQRIEATAPAASRPMLPEVALRGFDGETVSFSDYRGKALLVNFWASWCAPCRKELPQLKEYYGQLDRSRVEFLAISEDLDESAARRFAAPLDLPFPLFLGDGRMKGHFKYFGLPYTLVVDYRGRIVEEIQGFGGAESWRRLTSALEREMERAVPNPEQVRDPGQASEHEHGSH